MYRFLASRQWLVRTIAGLLLVALCVRLGIWQLDRHDQRSARNAVIEANLNGPPVPLADLTSADSPIADDDQWRTIEIVGRYDVERELTMRLRPVDGEAGVHAITPLITNDGTALLVDRGFIPSNGSGDDLPALPPPPAGDVRVLARIRASEEGRGAGVDPDRGTVRFLDVDEIAETMPYPLYGAWAELTEEQPPPAQALDLIPEPEIDAGPHLSYAIQWFLFAGVGLIGYVFLVRAEARGRREECAMEPTTIREQVP